MGNPNTHGVYMRDTQLERKRIQIHQNDLLGLFFFAIFCYHEREISTKVYRMVTKTNQAAVNMTKTRTKTQYK